VKLYRDDVPLFSRFQIEHQIETLLAQVPLPSALDRHRHTERWSPST